MKICDCCGAEVDDEGIAVVLPEGEIEAPEEEAHDDSAASDEAFLAALGKRGKQPPRMPKIEIEVEPEEESEISKKKRARYGGRS